MRSPLFFVFLTKALYQHPSHPTGYWYCRMRTSMPLPASIKATLATGV